MEDISDFHMSGLDAAMWACARELEETKIINASLKYFLYKRGNRS